MKLIGALNTSVYIVVVVVVVMVVVDILIKTK
jgi:hypothetical protein